jgi:hypothetical protein
MPLQVIPASHVDHVDRPVLTYLDMLYANRDNPDQIVLIETIELPPSLTVDCGLHGPAMGDDPVAEKDVVYRPRSGRSWPSRVVDRPTRRTQMLTVVAGPYQGDELVLYTCYGGPAAPRELADPQLSAKDISESLAFWKKHALSG